MELSHLVGLHTLDAVDFSTESCKSWGDMFEECQVVRFRLDGNVYMVVEDPSDGYRSSMRDITIDGDAIMQNTFAPIDVLASHRTTGRWSGTDDILELHDLITGKLVLEVGTDSVDDYYPCYVASFHPEAMCLNATVKDD